MTLNAQGLTKRFDGRPVIECFSFSFPARGLFALVGESGRGKTTLLYMLAGLLLPDEGTVTGNRPLSISFQEYRLFPYMTALDNVLCVQRTRHPDRACALLRSVGLTDEEMLYYPSMLSGGMKQRVSLVRALASDAPLVLLDEPIKELDPQIQQRVIELLREQAAERLLIVTAHSEAEAARLGAQPIVLS